MEKEITNEEVKCPMCGRKKAVIKIEDLYLCTYCNVQFDNRED